MEKQTPKKKAKEMYDHFFDNMSNILSHDEILEQCRYIANEKLHDAYKIDNRYIKDYYNFWHEVLIEFTTDEK